MAVRDISGMRARLLASGTVAVTLTFQGCWFDWSPRTVLPGEPEFVGSVMALQSSMEYLEGQDGPRSYDDFRARVNDSLGEPVAWYRSSTGSNAIAFPYWFRPGEEYGCVLAVPPGTERSRVPFMWRVKPGPGGQLAVLFYDGTLRFGGEDRITPSDLTRLLHELATENGGVPLPVAYGRMPEQGADPEPPDGVQ